ncbi:PREDICTED: uncharacterized protein LOC104809045 [Tarenaya hassleriana]|uniref:uncharacterized protein LOC104809045 n=1 Tax=Tarenaya hassleriana TaxID=28532 RepID=UPI00053C14F7|nr:PREDICTED: uncharacterized protein LOC104809045 [Tarenaya hassleriana]
MEGLQKFYSKVAKDAKSTFSSSSPLSEFTDNLIQNTRSGNLTSNDESRALVSRPPSGISLWNCSKLCAIFFVAGVFVGYTLKRRVKRWASKLLRRLKDD